MDWLPLGKASHEHMKHCLFAEKQGGGNSWLSPSAQTIAVIQLLKGIDSVGGELWKHTWEILVRKRRGHLGGLKNNWWVWAYNHHYVLCKCARTAALDQAQDGVGSKKGALKSKWIKIIQAKGSTYSTVSSLTFCWTASLHSFSAGFTFLMLDEHVLYVYRSVSFHIGVSSIILPFPR